MLFLMSRAAGDPRVCGGGPAAAKAGAVRLVLCLAPRHAWQCLHVLPCAALPLSLKPYALALAQRSGMVRSMLHQ